MFGLFKKKRSFFTTEENDLIVKAIRGAEQHTSGEVRVYVESRCSWVDAMDRASELFFSLRMQETQERNGVLVYVAMKDRQLAVFGDEGIYKKTGQDYWNEVVREMLSNFNRDDYAKGIADCVTKIGDALQQHFPYNRDTDRNELPDDIVFGR